MNCKYCHLKTHYIDKCPTIICKICKDVGHPQWLCTEKKNSKNIKNNIPTLDKKYYFTDDIKKTSNSEFIIQKTITYYLNIEKEFWGDLITI